MVMVTGAARGIGAAIAGRFLEEGARVAVLDLPAMADQAKALVQGQARATFFPCDVRSAADCDAAVARAIGWGGAPAVLVNNAGVAPSGDLETLPEADWDLTFDVNVKSIYLMSRRVVPAMRQAGGGVIINIASESAFITFETDPAYCASKAAVVHLTRCMALRHARDGIRVNSVCPGAIATEMWRDFCAQQDDPAATEREVLARHPLGFGTAQEVAGAVLYLASPEARYITGTPLSIDGGATSF